MPAARVGAVMPLSTTYLGHRIDIEPFEWGYLAHVLKPGSDAHLVAASSSVFKALDGAFEIIEDSLNDLRGTGEEVLSAAG
jgi:hypothetical protein